MKYVTGRESSAVIHIPGVIKIDVGTCKLIEGEQIVIKGDLISALPS